MKRFTAKQLLFIVAFSLLTIASQAQYLWNSDSAFKAGRANSGRLWGYMFGDYYAKGHSDSLNRGNANQYTGIPAGRSAFQFRRIYLGYDYNITQKFSAELLLAAEDNFPANNPPGSGTSGDELLNNKETFYIKLANIRWKNIWNGTDLVVGQQATPTFPMLTEKIWAYRSIERTITDIRRTPSYDLGVGLQGNFDPKTKNFGYNLLVANGSSAKPEADNFKWFYGDVYFMFLDKKLIFDLYGDYERIGWVPENGDIQYGHVSRQMTKAYVAYNTPALTIGVEAFVNHLQNAIAATNKSDGKTTYLSPNAQGISAYVHGDIIKNSLRFFARWDGYSPNNKVDNSLYSGYKAGVSTIGNYVDGTPVGSLNDITYKQMFITAGLDFTPAKNVHLMPNIWYNHYKTQLDGKSGAYNGDYDIVYRMTFYFVFGK
ncbi:MAG TPA: hypothetical protein VHE34_27820 [Puia sp.]|uniref:hypothetical protein n=1 Tax=Puia sp. TaxID=2045100 RepID=UPI002C7B973F|nr:hypothetical protein [Puia sp.]HVU99074.1 hypothetical protein [Puia sp.]